MYIIINTNVIKIFQKIIRYYQEKINKNFNNSMIIIILNNKSGNYINNKDNK